MIAVTISTPSYFDMANTQARYFRDHSDLDVVVIHAQTDAEGYAKKLDLPTMFRGQTVVFFDADWRLVRDTDFREFEDRHELFGVFDGAVHCPGTFLHTDTEALGLEGPKYINTGFWIANFRRKDHIKGFNIARQLMAEKTNGWHVGVADKTEQSWLNAGLQRARVEIKHLHPRYNFYLYGLDRGFVPAIPSRIIGLHAAGITGAGAKTKALDAQQLALCSQPSSKFDRIPIPAAAAAFHAWSDA